MVCRSVRDPRRPPSEPPQPETEVEVLVVAAEGRVEHRAAVERDLPQGRRAKEGGRAGDRDKITAGLGVAPVRLTAVELDREAKTIEVDTATVNGRSLPIYNCPLYRGESGVAVEGAPERPEPAG